MTFLQHLKTVVLGILVATVLLFVGVIFMHYPAPFTTGHAPVPVVHGFAPVAPKIDTAAVQYVAALDVARVFGRAAGCADAEPKLIDAVAAEAIKFNVDPRILAATVAVESSCNQYATSSKGAVGLLQVMPRTWKNAYDFETKYNLFNPTDNLHVGTEILAGFLKSYGIANGLHHYNGMGIGCDTCDGGYADRIIALAGRH